MFGIVLWILTLMLVVVIHEGGHFLAMRLCGIAVEEFSIGFGPLIYQRKASSGVTYSFRAVLVGGFVKPAGENASALFDEPSWLKRLFIFSAGMIANVVTATIVLGFVFHTFSGAALFSFGNWLVTPYIIAKMLVTMPKTLAAGMMGPVGIVSLGAKHAMTLDAWLKLFAIIHIGLAGINLVPLPVLDGGRIAMMPFRRWLGRKGELKLAAFSAIPLLLLFIWLIIKDVLKLFG